MEATDLSSNLTFTTFKAPVFPTGLQEFSKVYFMNLVGFQMNHVSEALKKKLPPTDSRLRPDVRQWEHANLELASKEKARLENN